jgi:hypothetical protein
MKLKHAINNKNNTKNNNNKVKEQDSKHTTQSINEFTINPIIIKPTFPLSNTIYKLYIQLNPHHALKGNISNIHKLNINVTK